MKTFKIENFERENEDTAFPSFRIVTGSELRKMTSTLKRMLKLPATSEGSLLVMEIAARATVLPDVNLEDDPSEFPVVMCNLELELAGKVYLNWGGYEEMDEIGSKDLLQYFDDIWYPSSDDLDIVDPALRWIVSIHHSGMVKYLRLKDDFMTQ